MDDKTNLALLRDYVKRRVRMSRGSCVHDELEKYVGADSTPCPNGNPLHHATTFGH
jgi:hypothetical protein